MNTTAEKIRRGVEAAERRKKVNVAIPLNSLLGAPSNFNQLNQRVGAVVNKMQALAVEAADITADIKKHREDLTELYADIGWEKGPNGVKRDEWGEAKRAKHINQHVNDYTRTRREENRENRRIMLADIEKLAASLEPVRDHYTNALAVLNRMTLGGRQRADYAETLKHAGPLAVEQAITDAMPNRNIFLAMACIDRLEAMGKEGKKLVRYSPQQIAESLLVEQVQHAKALFAVCDLNVKRAILEAKRAEGATVTVEETLEVGRLAKELEALMPDGFTIAVGEKPAVEISEEKQRPIHLTMPAPEGQTRCNVDGLIEIYARDPATGELAWRPKADMDAEKSAAETEEIWNKIVAAATTDDSEEKETADA